MEAAGRRGIKAAGVIIASSVTAISACSTVRLMAAQCGRVGQKSGAGIGDMDRALGGPDIAVDRGHHLGDRDRIRPPRQAIAAGGAARRPDQAGMSQRLQDLGDGGARQPGFEGQRRRGQLPIGIGRQMGGDDDAVIRELAQDDHRSGPDAYPDRGEFGPDWSAIDRR